MSENTTHTKVSHFSQHRPLYMLVAALVIMVAIWTWLAFSAPKQETLDQHVRNIASQLRCPVCQGESVADAPATLAQQMRGVIRQQIQEGKSDQQIVQYFINRYGAQNIVWSPPWQGFTILAWLVPLVLLLSGLILLFFVFRDWQLHGSALAQSTTTHEELPGHASDDTSFDDAELDQYRAQLEQELAVDDPLFRRKKMEAD